MNVAQKRKLAYRRVCIMQAVLASSTMSRTRSGRPAPALERMAVPPGDGPWDRIDGLFGGREERVFRFQNLRIALQNQDGVIRAGKNMVINFPVTDTAAELETISSADSPYGPPYEGRGRFFVLLALELVRISAVPVVRLSDAAAVRVGGVDVLLALLRMASGGRPWYEAFGFRADTPAVLDRVRDHLNRPVLELPMPSDDEAQELLHWSEVVVDYEEVVDYIGRAPPGKTLGQVISDLSLQRDGAMVNAMHMLFFPWDLWWDFVNMIYSKRV